MSKKIYNTQDWDIRCFYTNIKNDVAGEIDANNIVYIKIINTLEQYVPIIIIRVIDNGYELLKYLNTNRNYD